MKTRKSERGQAMVLIVFGIIAIVAVTGLAVDGGSAYADRRNAQNAADSAALAAGLAYVKNQNYTTAAVNLAKTNGYNNDGTTNTVVVTLDSSGQSCTNQQGQFVGQHVDLQPADITVTINSTKSTFFASVVGIKSLTNTVKATIGTCGTFAAPMYNGNAVVGLKQTGCNVVHVDASANLQTWNGGLFSNSTSVCGMTFDNAASIQTWDCNGCSGLHMVASDYKRNGSPTVNTHGEPVTTSMSQQPYPPPIGPNPVCAGNATTAGSSMTPGNYTGTFPPAGVTTLQSGTYCVTGNFVLHGTQLNGTGVVILLKTGGIDWSGASTEPKLSAPTTGALSGLLLYAPLSNSSTMNLSGDSNARLTGTIYLPGAPVVIGGFGAQINSQIIGYTVELSASSSTQIVTNTAAQYNPSSPGTLELKQ